MNNIEQLIEALRDYLALSPLDGRAQQLRKDLGELLDKIKAAPQSQSEQERQEQATAATATATTAPADLEAEDCVRCGSEKRHFKHQCPVGYDEVEVFGCPRHDNSCSSCR